METLLATNILLLVIVIAVVVLAAMLYVLLYHAIGATRRVKRIVTVLDDDVTRARSVILAAWNAVADTLGASPDRKNARRGGKRARTD